MTKTLRRTSADGLLNDYDVK
ncbi:hypothetical protein NPIL_32411, partial [Nephila pilipes]